MRHLTIPLALAMLLTLSACGKKEESASAPAPATSAPSPAPAPAPVAAAPAPAPAPSASAAPASAAASAPTTTAAAGGGQAIYSQTCVACHAAGVAGAPKIGDKADWGPRIAQGKDTLYAHAIQGYTGKKGVMPPKGGNVALPDADVRAAVDYMVSQGQ